MATLAHDVCDVHGASSLYIKTCWQSLYRVFPTGRMGQSPHHKKKKKFAHSPPPHQIFISSHQKSIQPNEKIKGSFSCTIFALIYSYSFKTQIMLIFLLIDVQYSQNAVFSFENFSNCQNHSSVSHHLVKKMPPAMFTNF